MGGRARGGINLSYGSSYTFNVGVAIGTINPTVTGDTASSFTVSSGALPTGLSLNAGTGAITGTPTDSGTSPVGITVTGAGGTTSSTSISFYAYQPNVLFTASGYWSNDF